METALEIGIPISSSDSSYGRLYFYGEVCQYAGGVLSGGASGCDGDGRIYRLLSGGAGSAVGADIGLSSRPLTTAEEASGAAVYVIAMDGIAVITDRDNPVTALTTKQLVDIYTGQIRDWQELGGRRLPIVVAGREAGSGTRSAFEELLGIEDRCYYANELDSEGAMLARIASTPGAVGYVSFDVLNDTVCALSLDGVEATAERVKTGSYPLCRSFLLVTKGALEEQSRQVREIFAYLQTEEGGKLMRDAGLIVSDCHK